MTTYANNFLGFFLYRFRSSYHARLFIIPVILFAFLYTLPKFFELRLEREPIPSNSTHQKYGYKLVPTALREDKYYIRVYLISINFLVQILIPFVTLVILNFMTYSTIKESEKKLLNNYRVHFSAPATQGGAGPRLSNSGECNSVHLVHRHAIEHQSSVVFSENQNQNHNSSSDEGHQINITSNNGYVMSYTVAYYF